VPSTTLNQNIYLLSTMQTQNYEVEEYNPHLQSPTLLSVVVHSYLLVHIRNLHCIMYVNIDSCSQDGTGLFFVNLEHPSLHKKSYDNIGSDLSSDPDPIRIRSVIRISGYWWSDQDPFWPDPVIYSSDPEPERKRIGSDRYFTVINVHNKMQPTMRRMYYFLISLIQYINLQYCTTYLGTF
jgi:hypothetical protein